MSSRPVSAAVKCTAAVLSFAWFLYAGFAPGWSRTTTDFPNYFTAARLVAAHKPLPPFYDYPSFQREIARAGVERQLGGYIPQTPLTMLPFIPLSGLKPLHAKQAWLLMNLGFLACSIWLLSRITRFKPLQVWLIVFLSFGALRQNFLLGQYYVLLLTLMTLGAWLLLRQRDGSAGAVFGGALVLKLYGGPFMLFLAAKRRMRAVVAATGVLLAAIAVAMAVFGWHGVAFYATQILPRTLSGETLNPFAPASNTFVTLLRRLFVAEAQLNPQPLVDSRALFAFLRCVFTMAIMLVPTLAAWNSPGPVTKVELASWSIALLLVSPNTASYTFVLLVLPIALLLDELPYREWFYVLAPYILLTLPVRGTWALLFPKAWLLLFLFIRYRPRQLKPPGVFGVFIVALGLLAAASAALLAARLPEKFAGALPLATEPEAIYSSAPVMTANGLFYESIAEERYVIKQWDNGTFATFALDGHALHPSAPDSGSRVYCELITGARSSIALIDLVERHSAILPLDAADPHDPAVSRDGRMVAFVSRGEIYLFDGRATRKLATRTSARNPSFVAGDSQLVYVAGGDRHSQIVLLDLRTGVERSLIDRDTELATPSISSGEDRLIYASRESGSWQIWIDDLVNHRPLQATHGGCNNWSPAWMPGSSEFVFASDCGRGLHLPALFRMRSPL